MFNHVSVVNDVSMIKISTFQRLRVHTIIYGLIVEVLSNWEESDRDFPPR